MIRSYVRIVTAPRECRIDVRSRQEGQPMDTPTGPISRDTISRRTLIGAAAGSLMTASSYARVIGANDRIQVGMLGCGHRSSGHRKMLKLSSQTDSNFDVRSVCDLWSVNREKAAADLQSLFGNRPKMFQHSEDMLADPELDAVMIGTGDHQHARIL